MRRRPSLPQEFTLHKLFGFVSEPGVWRGGMSGGQAAGGVEESVNRRAGLIFYHLFFFKNIVEDLWANQRNGI